MYKVLYDEQCLVYVWHTMYNLLYTPTPLLITKDAVEEQDYQKNALTRRKKDFLKEYLKKKDSYLVAKLNFYNWMFC